MNGHPHDGDPLDELLAAMRSDARPEELVAETESVDAMASVLDEVPNVTKLPSRLPRVAAIVAASVIGVGGLAAAGSGTFLPDSSNAPFDQAPPASRPPVSLPAAAAIHDVATTTSTSTTSTSTTSTSTTSTTSTTVALAPAVDGSTTTLVDDPSTEFDETQCAEGNHGKTVSSVAHSVPPGPGHGEAVSEAAQSSCGKGADDGVTSASGEGEGEGSVEGQGSGQGQGQGNSGQGNANGQGNGKGDDGSGQGSSNSGGQGNGEGRGRSGG